MSINNIKNIEIIKSIMDISENKEKTLLYFLDDNIIYKLNNYNLNINKDFYLNDYIILINKSSLDIEISGKIIYIKNDKIGILKNNRTIYYIRSNYYVFIKHFNRNNINNLKYFKELLNTLN